MGRNRKKVETDLVTGEHMYAHDAPITKGRLYTKTLPPSLLSNERERDDETKNSVMARLCNL